jgi:CubicO group peptidase (beta-lactamase class C family)
MNRVTALLSVLVITATGCGMPPPPPASVAIKNRAWSEQIEKGRAVLTPRLAVHPAVAVAVAVKGKIVWSEARGWANVEERRAATPETRFRLYSAAKPLTGTLALRLHQSGRLDLDAPIAKYLPETPAHLHNVTTRQLLGHLGGVRHYRDGEWLPASAALCKTARQALDKFANDPLVSAPGNAYAYSTFGFVLASAAIESAAARPFMQALAADILQPAAMSATTLDTPASYDSRTSSFYWEGRFGRTVEAPAIDNSCKFGGGGILTTVGDLARFGTALLDGKLVAAEAMEVLFTPQRARDGAATGYSLGWEVTEDGSRIAHSGGSPGGRSYLLVDRRNGVVIALLSNYEGERFTKDAAALLQIFAPPAK